MSTQTFYTGRLNGSIAQLEAEVAELEAAANPAGDPDPVTDTPVTEAVVEAEAPTTDAPLVDPTEASWRERYANLRRHQQDQDARHRQTVADLQRQIDALGTGQMQLPTSEADLEAWVAEYPDVAKIVRSLAMQEVQTAKADLDKRFEEVEEDRKAVARERALGELLKKHPDFLDLRATADFHDWAKDPEQPEYIRDALYRNDTDWKAASRAVDLYKQDRGLNKPATVAPKRDAKADTRAAAAPVKTGTTRDEPGANERTFKESEINKMRPAEFERLLPEIEKAQREGRIILDLSGGAR